MTLGSTLLPKLSLTATRKLSGRRFRKLGKVSLARRVIHG
jgi:hypothetical protein